MTKARDLANGGFGLVLVKPSSVVGGTDNGKGTESFTGASSVTLNNVFTSTYENYRIVCTGKGSSNNNMNARLVDNGSAYTTGNYRYNLIFMTYASSVVNGGNSGSGTKIPVTDINSTDDAMGFTMDLYSPKNSNRFTGYSSLSARGDQGFITLAGALAVTTSFDGIQLLPDTGTITGQVSVYGYNK